jgi:hypothetical protein
MKTKKRTAAVVAAWTTVGVLGVATLTGVAEAASSGSSPAAGSSSTASTASSSSTAAAGAGLAGAGRLRKLGQHVLHGELTVQTRAGVKVFDTELGVITAVTPTSLAVRSSDGFAQTWTLGSNVRVRADKAKGSTTDLTVGATVRLIGPTSGGTATVLLAIVQPATS